MFGPNGGMPGSFGFPGRKPEGFLDTRSVGKPGHYFPGRKNTHPILNLLFEHFAIHTHSFQDIRNNPVFQGQQAKQYVFRADKTVMKTGGFLPGQFQRPPGAWAKCAQGWSWIKSPSHNALEFPEPGPLFSAEFCEFLLEQAGFTNSLHGGLKCLLLAFSRLHLPCHVLAQMTFQFVRDIWILDAGGLHLPPPF
jgi:hypothetical protein